MLFQPQTLLLQLPHCFVAKLSLDFVPFLPMLLLLRPFRPFVMDFGAYPIAAEDWAGVVEKNVPR